MKYTLTIEAEDAAELSAVVNAFSGLGATVKPSKKAGTKASEQKEETSENGEVENSGSDISVEQFRKKLQGYFEKDKEKMTEVKALVAAAPYNAGAISEVKKEHYAEILAALKIS